VEEGFASADLYWVSISEPACGGERERVMQLAEESALLWGNELKPGR
jgi:hypothetical protein